MSVLFYLPLLGLYQVLCTFPLFPTQTLVSRLFLVSPLLFTKSISDASFNLLLLRVSGRFLSGRRPGVVGAWGVFLTLEPRLSLFSQTPGVRRVTLHHHAAHAHHGHTLAPVTRLEKRMNKGMLSQRSERLHTKYCTLTHIHIFTETSVLTHSEFSEKQGWSRTRSFTDVCPAATLKGSSGVRRRAEVPQRSASQQKRWRLRQLSSDPAIISLVPSPKSWWHSNAASMVPGFAARTLCLIKGPWNGDWQAEKRRREEDAWYLTSGRGGQMQWGGEERARVERRESEPGGEWGRERRCV